MRFYEVVTQVSALLQREGRVSYRALKLEFDLNDDVLDAVKEELIDIKELATDKGGKMLVWTGGAERTPSSDSGPRTPDSKPVNYTPQHLAERILAEQAAMESRGAADGERKTITALFADLKGSTALIEGLDPEDARALIDPALQLMMDAVHRYDGYVAQALGDGIFALFGAPLAHEDHPQRALYAALRMQEEMQVYSDQIRLKHGVPLDMRVGINTGEVVVRSIRKDDLHTDYVPVGHSTNLAARMEQMANPGTIVISEYTRKLTEGYFELKALGAATIKGVEEPLNVYEVLGAGPLRTRFQVTARRGLARFVGRHSELDQLQQALEQAKEGHGQIVGVMGEPGLGKSRLFYEFKLTSQSGCLVLEANAVSHGKASPYLPLIELLKSYFEITPEDDERKRRERVTGKVLALDRSLEDTLPYVFSLLGIDDPQSSLHQMDVQIRRQRTFEALKKLFLRESLNQPLLLIFEDLHWIDTETQGFLDTLSESVASAQVLLLVNSRPEYRHAWGQKTYYSQLRLAPLGKAEAEELLTFLLGHDESLQAVKALILEKTEGTPFFMEEVVQTLVEEGALTGERGSYRLDQAPTELHISPTVQGVLAARIDRLTAEEKALLQQLAVVGRQFPVSLIHLVVPQSETELYRVLSSLQAKEFVYEQPAFPESEYLFKHALTQDVAYGTLLQEQRKVLHERTGQAMETLYKENLEDHYSELAHHYSQSGNTAKAVEYLHLAGQQAVQRSAHGDALAALTAALELLATVPATFERSRRELALQTTLGAVHIAITGWTSPEVGHAYTRAWALGRQLESPADLFPVLIGLWVFYFVQGKFPKAQDFAEQLLPLARNAQSPYLQAAAHHSLAETCYVRGEIKRACAHFQQVASDDPTHPLPSWAWYDAGTTAVAYQALALWVLGYPDQSRQAGTAGLQLARERAHPWSVAFALNSTCHCHFFQRDWTALLTGAEALVALCHEQGLGSWLPFALVWHGRALVERGRAEEGMGYIHQSVTTWRAAGAEGAVLFMILPMVEAYRAKGQISEGLSLIAERRERLSETGECSSDAELYRLEGELQLQSKVEDLTATVAEEAEACFQQAIEIAQKQQAKSWELRAATSLARLWQQQDKITEARELLAPVYEWFTEGFDTADLKDAKALLVELETA